MENIIIRKIKLPYDVKGFTVLDNDNDYNVYLNALYNFEMNQTALKHEIEHIQDEDFHSLEDVFKLEG